MAIDPRLAATVDKVGEAAATLLPKVYDDALAPAVRRLSPDVELMSRTVHLALAPLRALVWGAERVEELIRVRVAEKLGHVPPEKIVEPPLNVVGPAFDSLRYAGHDDTLRELYASLIASAMNADTQASVHPAFAEMIRQMTPLDAQLLRYLRTDSLPLLEVRSSARGGERTVLIDFTTFGAIGEGSRHPAARITMDNLRRLGLAMTPPGKQYADEAAYSALWNHAEVVEEREHVRADGGTPMMGRSLLRMTSLGHDFCEACIGPLESAQSGHDAAYPSSSAAPR